MFSFRMLNKVILGGIITVAIIITSIGLFVMLDESENIDTDDKSTNQEYVPKKITLELSDGFNIGETGP